MLHFFYKKNRETNIFFLVPGGDIWMIFSWMHACIQRYLGLRWLEQVSYFIHIFRQITFCYFQNGRVFEVHSSKIEYSICNHFCPRHDKDGFGMTLLVKCPEDSKIQNLGGTVNLIDIDYFKIKWYINNKQLPMCNFRHGAQYNSSIVIIVPENPSIF